MNIYIYGVVDHTTGIQGMYTVQIIQFWILAKIHRALDNGRQTKIRSTMVENFLMNF